MRNITEIYYVVMLHNNCCETCKNDFPFSSEFSFAHKKGIYSSKFFWEKSKRWEKIKLKKSLHIKNTYFIYFIFIPKWRTQPLIQDELWRINKNCLPMFIQVEKLGNESSILQLMISRRNEKIRNLKSIKLFKIPIGCCWVNMWIIFCYISSR